MSSILLFAQAAGNAPAQAIPNYGPSEFLQWLYVWGEPSVTLGRWWGGLLSWSKVVGLYCLLAWAIGWLITGSRSNVPGAKGSPIKLGVVLAILVSGLLAALFGTLEQTESLKLTAIGPFKPGTWLGIVCGGLALGLVEYMLWSALLKRKARADLITLIMMQVVFGLGYLIAFRLNVINNGFLDRLSILQNEPEKAEEFRQLLRQYQEFLIGLRGQIGSSLELRFPDWMNLGVRIGGTYMGLVALIRVGCTLMVEVVAIRFRRIYSIAWQSIAEANRSSRAPYVVISLFVVVLAFTHWFLRSGERDAELSKGFVQTLTFLCSFLLLLMIVFIAPLSMPRDISNQTIYTIVSKPVLRLELIWGRLVGYMTLVTVLLVIFGIAGLGYLQRNVGSRIQELRDEAAKLESTNPSYAKQQFEAADQLEKRMSARVPLRGALTFQDAKKKEHDRGIDVGQEQEMRSFVEGATESRAVWKFEEVPDRFAPGGRRDLRIHVEALLRPGSIEALQDRLMILDDEQQEAAQSKAQGKLNAADVARISGQSSARTEEMDRIVKELQGLLAKEQEIRARIAKAPKADRPKIREELNEILSPPIPVEMSFTIYRTTKGIVGESVLANLKASNSFYEGPRARTRRVTESFSTMIPIHEYYTNRTYIPARVLVGSRGSLRLEVRCVTANQYLGMAEPDLYILEGSGGFRLNFIKGLFGIWLQVLVLTAIGLFAGAFLSWPVAILTTLFFFVFGQIAFSFLSLLAVQALDTQAFGPFESFIRILSHQNMQAALAPTPAVVAAKTADSILLPLLSRLVFLIPNFGALDVTNTVAEGFAITWTQILDLTLMGIGYALPFSVAGYFILKNREVAA